MKRYFLFLERVLSALAINSRGLFRNAMCRAWGWAFGACYSHGWLDD